MVVHLSSLVVPWEVVVGVGVLSQGTSSWSQSLPVGTSEWVTEQPCHVWTTSDTCVQKSSMGPQLHHLNDLFFVKCNIQWQPTMTTNKSHQIKPPKSIQSNSNHIKTNQINSNQINQITSTQSNQINPINSIQIKSNQFKSCQNNPNQLIQFISNQPKSNQINTVNSIKSIQIHPNQSNQTNQTTSDQYWSCEGCGLGFLFLSLYIPVYKKHIDHYHLAPQHAVGHLLMQTLLQMRLGLVVL